MAKVRFVAFGSNTQFGSFAPGDVLTCSEALARHLVNEIGCARYVETPAETKRPEPVQTKRRKGA